MPTVAAEIGQPKTQGVKPQFSRYPLAEGHIHPKNRRGPSNLAPRETYEKRGTSGGPSVSDSYGGRVENFEKMIAQPIDTKISSTIIVRLCFKQKPTPLAVDVPLA